MTKDDLVQATAEETLAQNGQLHSVQPIKTIGQLAKEAYGKELRKSMSWEAAANAVIEQCADMIETSPFLSKYSAEIIARSLRGLKEPIDK